MSHVNMAKKAQEENERFILLWEEEKNLWNVVLDEYKDRNKRENSIKKIWSILNMSGKYFASFDYEKLFLGMQITD